MEECISCGGRMTYKTDYDNGKPIVVYTCERCAELNGNDCDLDSCKERFKKYCEENVVILQ